jgi:hypothetical protein
LVISYESSVISHQSSVISQQVIDRIFCRSATPEIFRTNPRNGKSAAVDLQYSIARMKLRSPSAPGALVKASSMIANL